MDEVQQGSPVPEDRSSKTAAALRALRDGLGTKLETHRRRISDLETDLTSRVLQIAEELSAEQTAEAQAELQLHEDQLRRLRESLTEREGMIIKLEKQLSETELKHLRLTAELTESRSAIEVVRHTECTDCSRLRTDLAAAHSSAIEADRRLAELHAEVEQSAAELKQAQESIAKLETTKCQSCPEFESQLANAKRNQLVSESKSAELTAELDRVRQQLADSEQALDTWRATECVDCGRLRSQLATLQETSATAESQVAKLSEQVDELILQLSQARTAETELRVQHAADDSALAESKTSAEKIHKQLTEKVAALAAERDAIAEKLAASDAELFALKDKAGQELSSLEAQSAASELTNHQLTEQIAALAVERDELAEQLSQIQAELTARDESSDSEFSWLEKECESAEQSRKQLASEFEELLKQHKSSEQALSAAEIKKEQAVILLKQAEERILELSNSTEHQEALEQAERKFELALADAQKLKRENSELQEELARRPEKSETESPELVSLRVERDALASRVAELEAAPVPTIDADSEQQLSDLRRRFELAVEDLRHLKQENAQLQDKLAQAGSKAESSSLSHVAMDWQSQKARLLAVLDAEDVEEEDTERRQERTTIEGTITITDRVVADKDREIADLKAQLADQAFTAVETATPNNNAVDKDELIQAERTKLEALQKEWHDKLRTAELEMSVQRATLARKEAELQQKIQAAQQAQADAPLGPDGKPKRRWLSALGLRDDEEK